MAVPNRDEVRDFLTTRRALTRNGRLDIIAAHALVRADWDSSADTIVAILRAEAGRDPYDPDPQDLISELSTLSEEFREERGRHDARRHPSGEKAVSHPVVGRLDLIVESVDRTTDPGWELSIYAAEPACPAVDAPALLASWTATENHSTTASGSLSERTALSR